MMYCGLQQSRPLQFTNPGYDMASSPYHNLRGNYSAYKYFSLIFITKSLLLEHLNKCSPFNTPHLTQTSLTDDDFEELFVVKSVI